MLEREIRRCLTWAYGAGWLPLLTRLNKQQAQKQESLDRKIMAVNWPAQRDYASQGCETTFCGHAHAVYLN